MQQLSPKKYIETKARSLPIYKCLVNNDWQESQLAEVVVMRKHNNGHITAGIYLVDLLCLGVKDTFYFFNITERELEESVGTDLSKEFTVIDYPLAHNIVFAGVEFAEEYGISAHQEFTVTRYLLEEDTEDVPVIDISVGAEDGKPHLIVQHHNQFPDALAKLKRNAGEGNYHYTIHSEDDDSESTELDESDYDELEEIDETTHLDEIPLGQLNMINVQQVFMDDLMDVEKIKARKFYEQVIINAESLTRLLPDEIKELKPEDEDKWDDIWNEFLDQAEFPTGMTPEIMDEFYTSSDELIEGEQALAEDELTDEAVSENFLKVLEAHSENPMVVASIYETSTVMYLESVKERAKVFVDQYQQQYPYLQVSLALIALFGNSRDIKFDHIYNAIKLRQTFPQVKQFYPFEVINFWMIKMWQSIEEGKLKEAVQFYFIIRETQLNEWLFEPVLLKYNNLLLDYLKVVQMEKE